MNRDKPVRWWPAIAIGILAATSVLVIWAWPEVQRQERYQRTAGSFLMAGFLLFLWFLFFSRVGLKKRVGITFLFFAGLGLLAGAFRIRGVNGDLLPILELRWKGNQTFATTSALNGGTNANPTATNTLDLEGDFPQLYGPNRNAVLDSPLLETNWAEHPPQILWRRPVGTGWSGFAIKNGSAITQEQRGESEYVTCYEVKTGRPVWSHSDDVRYASTIAGEGPRATPTISSNRVYTFGGTGILNCFELPTGRRIWTADAAKENEAGIPDWGFASSPLVIDGKVVVSVGGSRGRSLVAYGAENGKLVWASGKGGADYSSPIAAALLGEQQVIIFNGSGINSHALNGNVLWNYPWPGVHPRVSLPVVVSSNLLLVSSGYGVGSEFLRVERDEQEKWSVTRLWKGLSLKSKFAPIFVKDDYIYGLDDGILVCVELKTGQRKWKDGRYGHGQGLFVAGLLLLTSEKGEAVLIEPSPEKLLEIGRIQVFSDKTWNPPALTGGYFLMRNDKEAACLQLVTKKELAKNVALSFAKQVLHR